MPTSLARPSRSRSSRSSPRRWSRRRGYRRRASRSTSRSVMAAGPQPPAPVRPSLRPGLRLAGARRCRPRVGGRRRRGGGVRAGGHGRLARRGARGLAGIGFPLDGCCPGGAEEGVATGTWRRLGGRDAAARRRGGRGDVPVRVGESAAARSPRTRPPAGPLRSRLPLGRPIRRRRASVAGECHSADGDGEGAGTEDDRTVRGAMGQPGSDRHRPGVHESGGMSGNGCAPRRGPAGRRDLARRGRRPPRWTPAGGAGTGGRGEWRRATAGGCPGDAGPTPALDADQRRGGHEATFGHQGGDGVGRLLRRGPDGSVGDSGPAATLNGLGAVTNEIACRWIVEARSRSGRGLVWRAGAVVHGGRQPSQADQGGDFGGNFLILLVASSLRCGAPGSSRDGTGSVLVSGDDAERRDVEVPTPVAGAVTPGLVALSLWTEGSRLTPGGRGRQARPARRRSERRRRPDDSGQGPAAGAPATGRSWGCVEPAGRRRGRRRGRGIAVRGGACPMAASGCRRRWAPSLAPRPRRSRACPVG